MSGIPLLVPTSREKGQGLIEYALILVLVAIVVIAILLLLGPVVGNVFSNITTNLQQTGVIAPDSPPFSVTSVSVPGGVSAGGGTSSATWSANCSVGGCTVTVTCNFLNNGGNSIGTISTSSSPCTVPDSSGHSVTVQVTNASATGYTWDGSAPSYP